MSHTDEYDDSDVTSSATQHPLAAANSADISSDSSDDISNDMRGNISDDISNTSGQGEQGDITNDDITDSRESLPLPLPPPPAGMSLSPAGVSPAQSEAQAPSKWASVINAASFGYFGTSGKAVEAPKPITAERRRHEVRHIHFPSATAVLLCDSSICRTPRLAVMSIRKLVGVLKAHLLQTFTHTCRVVNDYAIDFSSVLYHTTNIHEDFEIATWEYQKCNNQWPASRMY